MIETLTGMTARQITVADWLRVVQAEYLEMPGQQLTKPQIRRLWGLEPDTCDALLEELLAAHFLRRTQRDAYVLDVPSCESDEGVSGIPALKRADVVRALEEIRVGRAAV